MEIDFEEIMDQDFDDTDYANDMIEHDTYHVEKFVPSAKIRALNDRTKYCMIQCYTTGGALTVYATCMIRLISRIAF